MSAELSVTEIRNALRCPRVFALGRQLGHPVCFPVGASALGATFHRIVEAFARGVDAPPLAIRELGAGTDDGRVARAIRWWVLDYLVRELESRPQLASMPAELDDLAEALRSFADFIAGNLREHGGTPSSAVAALLRGSEVEVEASVPLSNDQSARVGGRVDAILAHPGGSFDVVEYKLTDEANESLDRAQVALYRFLVRKQLGIDAHPTILRFDPSLTITRIAPEDADRLVESSLFPLIREMVEWARGGKPAPPTTRADLCAVCPVRRPCAATYRDRMVARDDPPAGGVRPRPDPDGEIGPPGPCETLPSSSQPADEQGASEAAATQQRILELLRGIGVPATIVGRPRLGPTLIAFQVSAGRGSVQRLDREAQDLEHKLITNHGIRATYEKQGGMRVLHVVRSSPRPVVLQDLLSRSEAFLQERPGRFVVGENTAGEPLTADLGSPACCHLLIGGMTGSGKSVLLRSIVIGLAHYHGPTDIQFTLVDPKRVGFASLRAPLASHLANPLCYDCEEALGILEGLADEMDDRYRAFEEEQVEDIDDYNEAVPHARLPRHVVVIDEFQDLVVSKSLRPAFEEVVQRLGAKARAAGIHLVLATQRPDAKTVHPGIKANIPGKIALKVQSPVNSRIILAEGGAENLLGKGDLLADLGRGVVRAQGPLA